MLIVRSIGPDAVRYYLDGRGTGAWTPAAGRLLGLAGPVTAPDLSRILRGRHPESGAYLSARRPRRRRAGWDLMFAAPKSVSLLAASSGGEAGAALAGAHSAAVAALIAHLESGLSVRAMMGTATGRKADGVIGAAFEHHWNAAGEPHLHTHVLIANLSRSGPVWSAVDPREWQVERQALTARYQLELRHRVEVAGFGQAWRLRDDGLADLVAVPRAAVRAASTQSRMVARVGRFDARAAAVPAAWSESVRAAGLAPRAGLARVNRLAPTAARPPAETSAPDQLLRAVTVRLAARRSDFRRADVVTALAECHPGGMASAEVSEWVERFCARSEPVLSPTSHPRWATAVGRRIDTELRDELLGRGAGVTVLSGPAGACSLLAQAELVASWRLEWEKAGRRVSVDARDPLSARRWEALTGAGPTDPTRPAGPADVLIVDNADHRTTGSLLALARSTPARLVLVEGGTRPRLTNPASHGARDAADTLERVNAPEPEPWRLVAGADQPGPGRAAAERLLARWDAAGRSGVLVALGLEEMKALNRAVAGPRRTDGRFQIGDRVMVLRGGAGLPRYGTLGTVAGTRPLMVSWSGSESAAVRSDAEQRIGFGWAVSPRIAARTPGSQLHVLGPEQVRRSGRDLVVGLGGL